MNVDYYRRVSLAPYPALRLAVLLCVGIWAGKFFADMSSLYWAVAATLSAMGWIAAWKWPVRGLSRFKIASEQTCYILFVLLFGAFWYSNHADKITQERPELMLTFADEPLTAWGTIHRYRITETGGVSYEMYVDSVLSPQGNLWGEFFDVSGFIRQENMNQPFIYGDYVSLKGNFQEIGKPRNPHEFDFKSIMARRGIHLNFWADEILEVTDDTNKLGWNYWRTYTRGLLTSIFTEKNEPLARAIILGDRSGLDRAEQLAFSRAGLAHLMAVSGMHVGFLLFPVWFLLPYLWDKPWKQWLGLSGVMLLLFIYAGITGFTVSVLRASVMAILLFYAKTFRMHGESLNYLGVAALVVLLFSPAQLFEIGFQLSFVAVIVILLMLPVLRQSLPFKYRYSKIGGLYQLVMVSVIVQAGLYPILVYYFGEFSIIGPVSNTLAAFLVQVAFSITLVTMVLATFSPALAGFLNTPTDYFFGLLNELVGIAAAWDFAWIEVSVTSTLIFLIWAAGIYALATIQNPYLRWKAVIVFLSFLCVYQAEKIFLNFSQDKLEIVFFDVGQGDAALITTPDGRSLLVDTGVWTPARNSGETILLPELQARGISHLDAVILSHPHADHIGGILELIRHVSVDTIYDAGFEYGSVLFQNFTKETQKRNIPVVHPALGDIIWVGEQLPFFILSPHAKLSGTDPNTYSIVAKMYFGDKSVMFTGDATSQTERYLAEHFGDFLKSDLLKVSHHGSNTSSQEIFLRYNQPDFSVVSLAIRNRYNHPHLEAVLRLSKSGTQLLFTSLEGAVIFKTDGKEMIRQNWR